MKSWKVPAVIFGLLILALIFRWGDLGSSTNNGITIKTKADHWNGSVWQTTIKNGSYSEKIIKPSWIEASRKPIQKQEEYQEPIYSNVKPDSLFKFATTKPIVGYYTASKTIQVPPPPIYWLSSDGLLKIWIYATLVVGMWLIIAVIITQKKRNLAMNK